MGQGRVKAAVIVAMETAQLVDGRTSRTHIRVMLSQ